MDLWVGGKRGRGKKEMMEVDGCFPKRGDMVVWVQDERWESGTELLGICGGADGNGSSRCGMGCGGVEGKVGGVDVDADVD